MVSLKRYTSITPLIELITLITASSIWSGVNAQYDGESTDTTTSYDDGQWTDTTTSTDSPESTTTSIPDVTTTTTDEITTTTDSFITPSPTFTTTVDVPTTTDDILTTTDAIPTTTDELSSSEAVPTVLPSSSIIVTPSPTAIASSGSNTNVGAIAGGVVGGVCAVALIGAIAFLLVRRRKTRSAADREVFRPENDDDEYAGPIQHSESSWRDSQTGNYPSVTSAAPPPPRHTYIAENQHMY